MSLYMRPQSQLGKCICTDLGVRAFEGLGKNSPSCEQVVRRITRDMHTHPVLLNLWIVKFDPTCPCTVVVSLLWLSSLLTGWPHHIDVITQALLIKYVMKRSGSPILSSRGASEMDSMIRVGVLP